VRRVAALCVDTALRVNAYYESIARMSSGRKLPGLSKSGRIYSRRKQSNFDEKSFPVLGEDTYRQLRPVAMRWRCAATLHRTSVRCNKDKYLMALAMELAIENAKDEVANGTE